jgi:hypothetical protein
MNDRYGYRKGEVPSYKSTAIKAGACCYNLIKGAVTLNPFDFVKGAVNGVDAVHSAIKGFDEAERKRLIRIGKAEKLQTVFEVIVFVIFLITMILLMLFADSSFVKTYVLRSVIAIMPMLLLGAIFHVYYVRDHVIFSAILGIIGIIVTAIFMIININNNDVVFSTALVNALFQFLSIIVGLLIGIFLCLILQNVADTLV